MESKMISYETYKTIHLFFVLIFFSSLGFVASSSPYFAKKSAKIIAGLVSFMIMVAGMGLIARIGFKHGQAFPLWLNLKFVAWILINILFVSLFRLKTFNQKAMASSLILLIGLGAVWVILNKPV